MMGKKLKTVIRGNTVYEIDKFSKKPKHIMHDVDTYFKLRKTDNEEENEEREIPEREEPKQISSHSRFKSIQNLAIGNSKKSTIIKEADGLNKDIIIDETEHEPNPEKYAYIKYDTKYRKSKKVIKPKRKIVKKTVKKCRCKK
jgi:hypothetical protein